MKSALSWIGGAIVVLAIIIGLPWLVMGSGFFLHRYFAPKTESVRRQVFEQSKAFNQGMIQEIGAMQFQYEQAGDEHKAALASIILHRVADFDESVMPPDMRLFIQELRHERTGH